MRQWTIRALALLIVVTGALAGYHAGAQEVPDQGKVSTLKPGQVMRVGDKIITAEDLIARIWDFERVIPQDERVLANSLTYLRDTSLLDLESERMGVKMTDAELDAVTEQQLDAIKKKVKEQTRGMLTYEKWLEQEGMTKTEFEKYVRDRAYIILLKRFLVTYFEQTTRSISASHILIKDDIILANKLHKQLKDAKADGMTVKQIEDLFEDLAVQYSNDPSAGVNRGHLPKLYENDGTVVKPVAETCWDLEDDEFSKPVKSQFGWHILLRHETSTPLGRTFAEMRDDLIKASDVNETRFNRWVRWVFNTQKYEVERRLPGWDVEHDD